VLAEEIAWLDARYPGRVGAGFGSGGNESDFRLVGVPFEERNARFDRALREIVAILRDGRHPETRATDPAIVRVARSGLPLLSAAMSARAARRAAEIRIGIIGSSLLSETRTRELADLYTGHGGVGPHVLIARVWLGSPPWDLVERQLEEYRRASADNLTTPAGGELLHGDDPSGIAEQLAHRMRSTRADALNIRVHVRGVEPAAAREQIAAVGAEIVPRVRAASAP
jgi:alkanesulfonate monooxygenase SsuD/methylene tetrahydromethanopterin reductase-like flavin-dependent oxidoreductase (luciferase family)